ncbi:FtsH protease activity modulator HflK [Paracoccaceae bacterium GXU_MW_L88]
MPYSDKGGPWGSGNGSNGGGNEPPKTPPKTPWGQSDRPQRPQQGQKPGQQQGEIDIDEVIRQGQEKLKVIFGGKSGNGGGGNTPGGGRGPGGFGIGLIVLVVMAGVWLYNSFYSVKPEEQSVELFLGEFSEIGNSGLNFAPWPLVTHEVLPVTRENTVDIGVGAPESNDSGLMLTGDENIVDIDFQVVWNISDPAQYLFNLAEPEETIRAVSESAMREVVGRSQLGPILNRDRGIISDEVLNIIQTTLDTYNSGVRIVRLNFDKADPPSEVIDAFRDVQAAEQERDTLEKRADAYANEVLAGARGDAARILQDAEAYRARVVNEATGEAARFNSVLEEYAEAEVVTRKRLYLETMEQVLGQSQKVILNQPDGGQSVLPYLPLDQLQRSNTNTDEEQQ